MLRILIQILFLVSLIVPVSAGTYRGNGSSFAEIDVYRGNGSSFDAVTVYRGNGSSWDDISNAGGGSGQDYYEDFTTITNWTAVNSTSIELDTGTIRLRDGSWAEEVAIYASQTDTVEQYAKVSFTAADGKYPALVFRYQNASSPNYRIHFWVQEDSVSWTEAATSSDGGSVVQSGSLTIATDDTLGVTVSGTGDSTVVRIWSNPTANAPTNASTWDGSSADLEFTNNPTTAADIGKYGGVATEQLSASTWFDDFYFGDI